MLPRNIALIFAGGSDIRMNNAAKPKQFLQFYGEEIIIYTLEHFEAHPDIGTIRLLPKTTATHYSIIMV
jgi:2-C-methyl-D-erythritol 4-phosphate cytidylyltransferase